MAPAAEQRGSVAEAEAEQRGHAPDPALEERDQQPESFDPGPERYDSRRAKRAARRREKAERKRREKAGRKRRKRAKLARVDPGEGAGPEREQAESKPSRRDAEAIRREVWRATEQDRERVRRERLAELERAEQLEEYRRARPGGSRRDSEGRGAVEEKQLVQHRLERRFRQERERAEVPPQPSLKRPTAKVGLALVAVMAVAAGVGYLLGLPLPLIDDADTDASAAGAPIVATLGPGTPKGLTKGPYHPVVVANPDYAEAAARFGASRGGRRHEGQDVFARPGTPLVAVRDGVVLDGGGGKSFYSYGGGNTFVMYSPLDGRSYIYLHMKEPAVVRAGEEVKAGQLIGYVGCTGSCDGPHLHFEVRQGRAVYGPQKKAIDPLPLLERWPLRPVP